MRSKSCAVHFACAIRTLFMITIVPFFFFSFLFFFFFFLLSTQKRYVIGEAKMAKEGIRWKGKLYLEYVTRLKLNCFMQA